ncbi:hypothetical protein TIFTF001_049032, partial [Ficus carica]
MKRDQDDYLLLRGFAGTTVEKGIVVGVGGELIAARFEWNGLAVAVRGGGSLRALVDWVRGSYARGPRPPCSCRSGLSMGGGFI